MDEVRSARKHEIDFVKGMLVVGMVLYHCLDYQQTDAGLLKFVRFITGAFIFVSGFLVSHLQMARYQQRGKELSSRLCIRGAKLIALVLFLNAVLYSLGLLPLGRHGMAMRDELIVVLTSGSYRIMAFDILIPIAYCLILTAGLIFVFQRRIRLHLLFAAAAFLYCSILYYGNQEAYNLRYVTIGICGFALGFIDREKLANVSRFALPIAGLFAVYAIALHAIRLYYPVYVLVVVFNIAALYAAGSRLSPANYVVGKIDLLGEYSLFAYLAQIAVLQVLTGLLRRHFTTPWAIAASFFATNVCVLLAVTLVSRYRAGSKTVDKLYRFVFA